MEILKDIAEMIEEGTGLTCSLWKIPRDGNHIRKAPYVVLEKFDGGVEYADNKPLVITTEVKATLVIAPDDTACETLMDRFLWEKGLHFSYDMGYDSAMDVVGKQYSFTVLQDFKEVI